MKLSDLKNQIINKRPINNFMIFKCEDSFFIAEQYVKEISENNDFDIKYINSLAEIQKNDLDLFLVSNSLYILKTDTFSEIVDDYNILENCIVICNKVDKKIDSLVNDFIVEFTTPEEWQVIDFIKTICTNIDDNDSKWLYYATNKDLYRLNNELDKIKLFYNDEQKEIINYFKYNTNTDLYQITTFELSDYIIKNNLTELFQYFIHKSSTMIEAMSLINLLIGQYKKITLVKYSTLDAQKIGISQAQYNYLKYNSNLSEVYLTKALLFLTNIDSRIREGKIDLGKSNILDYVICRLISLK